jgi:hypothetical protein
MRQGMDGYGGGVLGRSQGFGYLGGNDAQFTLQAVVTGSPEPTEIPQTITWQVTVNAGSTPPGLTHTSLSMTVTINYPVGSTISNPTDVNLAGWTNASGWSGSGTASFTATFTRASQGPTPSAANMTWTQSSTGAEPGFAVFTVTALSSSQKPTGWTGAPSFANVTLQEGSTFDATITNPPNGHVVALDYANGDTLAFDMTVAVGVNSQTNIAIEMSITDNYGGSYITNVTLDTNMLSLIGTGWFHLGWTNVGGVWKNSFFANAVPVGTQVITSRVHFDTGANSPHVIASTNNDGVPTTSQATGVGNDVDVNTNPI